MSVFAHSRAVFVPHIFVWGSCFWFCIPPSASSRRRLLLTHNLLTHNLLTHNLSTHNLLTHNLLTHTTCSHTTCPHATYSHTQLVHTQLVHTQLTHTQLVHTQLVHTQLVHTQLAHTQLVHTQLTHTQLAHTQLRGRRGTWGHVAALCVAGVALWDIHLRFTWQAWYLDTSTSTLRGRRGTYGIGLAPAARLVLRCRRRRCGFFCGRRGTCTLRGRRGTLRHPPSFHVAGAVFGHIDFHFAWQAWHVWHRAGSGGALGSQVSPWALRLFAWQAWHLATCSCALRGKRGTNGHT